jgi:uncharacterized membrane protein YheB (UPF0754 family)
LNKSLITNIAALSLAIVAYSIQHSLLFTVSIFALSRAITNWLAVHMLFEKVPGMYGSGIIPALFEDFKLSIRELMMTQFFSEENIDRILNRDKAQNPGQHLSPVIEKINLEPAFNTLVKTIMESSFGGMSSDEFSYLLIDQLEQPDATADIRQNVHSIINKRLDELTPELVKIIIQDMIRKHLGWLVVWGGGFGGLIGLVSASLDIL